MSKEGKKKKMFGRRKKQVVEPPAQEAEKVKIFSSAPEVRDDEIQYSETDVLGEGTFGVVYKGRCRGCPVAIKIPRRGQGGVTELTQKQLEQFKAEIEVMSKLYHPNICLFMGAFIDTKLGLIKLVSELLTCDIEQLLLDTRVDLSLYERIGFAEQAAEGMAWLHGAGVIHCDFKPSNLLYEERTKTVKICDFGLSRLVPFGDHLKGTKVRGSAIYIAPEVAQGTGIDHTADVYAFGIALYEFIERQIPFAHHSDIKVFLQAVVLDHERPKLPRDPLLVPNSLRDLCHDCWNADKTMRPPFTTIVERMPAILADCAIYDDRGRKFWKSNFIDVDEGGLMTNVPWPEFRDHFHDTFWGEPIPSDLDSALCIEALFAKNGEVNIAKFGKILGFLGPLRRTKKKWINYITAVMAQPWFFGDYSGSEAQSKLSVSNVPNGAFLIRFSGKDANFTLSYVHGGRVWHTRIIHHHGDQQFQLEGGQNVYNSLGSFVDALKTKKIVTTPCPGWPFEHLFGDGKQSGGYAVLEGI